ncbi:MAG: hypothetical protein Kow00123_09150 [Anaerolineales bacterium]
MSERPRDEKEEEKRHEKEDEKREEKSAEEKWQRDPLGTVIWAGILIWAGFILLAGNLGYLDAWAKQLGVSDLSAWNFVFLGAALLLVLEILLRLAIPAYRRPVVGTAIFALILFGIGLGDRFGWELIWPAILIILGLSILLRGFVRRR